MPTREEKRKIIGKALDYFAECYSIFTEQILRYTYKSKYSEMIVTILNRDSIKKYTESNINLKDPQVLLKLLGNMYHLRWNQNPPPYIGGPTIKSRIFECRAIRNKWAHNEEFSTDDVYRALETIETLLKVIESDYEYRKVKVLRIRILNKLYLKYQHFNTSDSSLVHCKRYRNICETEPAYDDNEHSSHHDYVITRSNKKHYSIYTSSNESSPERDSSQHTPDHMMDSTLPSQQHHPLPTRKNEFRSNGNHGYNPNFGEENTYNYGIHRPIDDQIPHNPFQSNRQPPPPNPHSSDHIHVHNNNTHLNHQPPIHHHFNTPYGHPPPQNFPPNNHPF